MKLHILGICGTFMAGIAMLAKQLGFDVSGCDENIYPPMSDFLQKFNIPVRLGYDAKYILDQDYILVGNVIKRGNPCIEAVLNLRLPFNSGPGWLFDNILRNKIVLAVSGTHGKTTTSSLLAYLLNACHEQAGFLVGGIPENFSSPAMLSKSPYFVIEADEYDSAFFDKRSKFIHYRPKILVMNNLEYDHADIFPHLSAIKQQFHYLVRTIPGNGTIVYNYQDPNIADVLTQGCFSQTMTFNDEQNGLNARLIAEDGSEFDVFDKNEKLGRVDWNLIGYHNVSNALAALTSLKALGFDIHQAIGAFKNFKSVKRRLELKNHLQGISIYDDFAHHPTAILTTLKGLRNKVGKDARIIAVLELGSYSMRTGVHKDTLPEVLAHADIILVLAPTHDFGIKEMLARLAKPNACYPSVESLITHLVPLLRVNDHVLAMSNSGFGGFHDKLANALTKEVYERSG